eukprot:MONOS_9228.1-p1 / transcript=MONOS_9228.1 / gene=MONOS_9228 / organism=Monocercomonoides_exilis_PA203 / gene_product=unspecified product / transcript_product=unspecified product / location=Mono_scaffold00373:6201-7633(+) / protein_length=426 / sequence_SO=supercontig / SO=protein_coding / is_pseudo=false
MFNELFSELEDCNEEEQKQKIEEMNGLMEEMDEKELISVIIKELFNRILKMIEEKKLTMGNAILLLKHMGYCKALKKIMTLFFERSSLNKRFKKMIIDENEKKEGKDEKLMADLCECIFLISHLFLTLPKELYGICVPCLLNVALKKEKDEETQKEVEMALFAFSCISRYYQIEKELYLKEITEIIKYHQEHHNLTRLAYQSAWKFLMDRLLQESSLEDTIVNELHFEREARREVEELSKGVDWKKKEEEMGETERKAMDIISRWFGPIGYYFYSCHLWNEEYVELISRIVDLFRASRDNHSEISEQCINLFAEITKNKAIQNGSLLKSGVVDLFLEEMAQRTLNGVSVQKWKEFICALSKSLKEKANEENSEAVLKKTNRQIFDKLEEEGYEDAIISIQKIKHFSFRVFDLGSSLNISDCFIII